MGALCYARPLSFGVGTTITLLISPLVLFVSRHPVSPFIVALSCSIFSRIVTSEDGLRGGGGTMCDEAPCDPCYVSAASFFATFPSILIAGTPMSMPLTK